MNTISAITIPEGSVKMIHDSNNKLIWHRPKIYGVSWAGGTAATMTRTDDAAGFGSVTVGTGSTAGSSPFNDCYPWSEMKIVTDSGNILVSIPKFYYKWAKSGTTMTL